MFIHYSEVRESEVAKLYLSKKLLLRYIPSRLYTVWFLYSRKQWPNSFIPLTWDKGRMNDDQFFDRTNSSDTKIICRSRFLVYIVKGIELIAEWIRVAGIFCSSGTPPRCSDCRYWGKVSRDISRAGGLILKTMESEKSFLWLGDIAWALERRNFGFTSFFHIYIIYFQSDGYDRCLYEYLCWRVEQAGDSPGFITINNDKGHLAFDSSFAKNNDSYDVTC